MGDVSSMGTSGEWPGLFQSPWIFFVKKAGRNFVNGVLERERLIAEQEEAAKGASGSRRVGLGRSETL